jgi:hypothetical protein
VKITNVEAGLKPPRVTSLNSIRRGRSVALEGRLENLGDGAAVEVSFEYRPLRPLTDLYERTEAWKAMAFEKQSSPGPFKLTLTGLDSDKEYEFRAVARNAAITVYGEERKVGK